MPDQTTVSIDGSPEIPWAEFMRRVDRLVGLKNGSAFTGAMSEAAKTIADLLISNMSDMEVGFLAAGDEVFKVAIVLEFQAGVSSTIKGRAKINFPTGAKIKDEAHFGAGQRTLEFQRPGE